MSNEDLEDFGLIQRQRQIQSKLGKLKGYRDWYQTTFNRELDKSDVGEFQPYSLKGTTMKQEQALRDLAKDYGFENMRGFNNYMKGADVTYYDLIKVASPTA